eukprot:1042873-Prymnesium_polylepis.2
MRVPSNDNTRTRESETGGPCSVGWPVRPRIPAGPRGTLAAPYQSRAEGARAARPLERPPARPKKRREARGEKPRASPARGVEGSLTAAARPPEQA